MDSQNTAKGMQDMLTQAGYYLFIAAVIVVGLLLAVSALPVPGGTEIKIVQSGSMAPTITTGSVVIIRPTGSYEIDDVITYGPDTQTQVPTTHRIVVTEEVDGQIQYITKGDANDQPDPQPVSEDEIIGEVLLSVPYLGYVLNFARQPIGFLLLVGLPAAIVIFDETRKIYREITGRENKKSDDKS